MKLGEYRSGEDLAGVEGEEKNNFWKKNYLK